MSENSESVTGDFTANLAALHREVAHMAETISDLVRNQAAAAGLGVSEAVGHAGDKIASSAICARNSVRAARGELEGRIGHNPLTAVLLAFAVGASIGLIGRSRR